MSRPSPSHPAARAAHTLRAAGLQAATLAILAALSIGSAGAQPVSPAEVLLFETDHLAQMKAPTTLVYEFRKLSNVEPAFTDSVQLDVSRSKGQLHAALHFLSGARQRELPEVDDAHGNPVLLGFLEHDIAEMKRLTGGSVTYFRKRIRMALANSAQVTPQRITYQGKTVEGRAVRIQPYIDDPLRARFEIYTSKTYTFVLSDAVPGGIYQVSTSLANAGDKRQPPGTVVARTSAPGGSASGAAGPDAPTPGMAAHAVATPKAAAPGAAPGSAAASGVAQTGAARPGSAVPGAATPVIDETLTLVKVVGPNR
jgi:hypothetical protein